MKKTFAVYIDIEGSTVGRISMQDYECYIKQEEMTLKGCEGYRELKVCNIEVEMPFYDIDTLVSNGRNLIRAQARKAIENKRAELTAMELAFDKAYPKNSDQAA